MAESESAWQEYKILQDKVDRIADFRFRIKSWMVTIVLAISFGGYATGRLPPIAYAGLAFVVLVFFLFEQSQAAWHNAFINRLLELEKDIAFLEARKAIATPEIESLKRTTGPRVGPAISRERRRIRSIRFIGPARHFVISYSHGLFYFCTLLVVAFTWWLAYSLPTMPVQGLATNPTPEVPVNVTQGRPSEVPSEVQEVEEIQGGREPAAETPDSDDGPTPNDAVQEQR